MEMKEEIRGEVLIIALEGELMGGEESRRFQDRITRAIQEETISVVVNMADIKWINSSGLGIMRGSGGDLKLANVSERVRRPIEVTKLDTVIRMFESIDEAVESYGSGG